MIWIGYTTHYREGSEKFALAARTLRDELVGGPDWVPREIRVEPLRSKTDFVSAMQQIESAQQRIEQLHIIGHSGMYGIMFGSTRWPEQLSPHPIRAAHEYRWYLESRFPGRRLETLNVGRQVRLVAFDSGALEPGHPTPLSYP
jgi:hypothetical protein